MPVHLSLLEADMLTQIEKDCLLACQQCTAASLTCASACLKEDDVQAMAHCIALDMACADVTRLAAASIARGDAHLKAVCLLCAQVCESCATECARHAMAHCQQCAEACRRCAAACSSMATGYL
jgi:hypothetical protein